MMHRIKCMLLGALPMNKYIALFLVMAAMPFSVAKAEPTNKKIVVSFSADGQTFSSCKISSKEIVNQKNTICINVRYTGYKELTPMALEEMVALAEAGPAVLKVNYTGKTTEELLATVEAWENFLETENVGVNAADWNLTIVSQDQNNLVVRYENAVMGKSFTFPMTLNYEIPKS